LYMAKTGTYTFHETGGKGNKKYKIRLVNC